MDAVYKESVSRVIDWRLALPLSLIIVLIQISLSYCKMQITVGQIEKIQLWEHFQNLIEKSYMTNSIHLTYKHVRSLSDLNTAASDKSGKM